MRWRITVRGDNAELRGWLDGDLTTVAAFSDAMRPYGLVIGSPADDDYNPFES